MNHIELSPTKRRHHTHLRDTRRRMLEPTEAQGDMRQSTADRFKTLQNQAMRAHVKRTLGDSWEIDQDGVPYLSKLNMTL